MKLAVHKLIAFLLCTAIFIGSVFLFSSTAVAEGETENVEETEQAEGNEKTSNINI